MSLVTLLRVLVVAVILLPVLGVTIDTMAPGLLPPELAAYSESQLEGPMRPSEIVLMALAVPLLVSSIGLWLLKPWARWLYTAVTSVEMEMLNPSGSTTAKSRAPQG